MNILYYKYYNYNSSKISIGTVVKNLEMLKLILDELKTKKKCKHAVKKLPFAIRYTPDQQMRLNKCVIKFFLKMVEFRICS